MRMTTARLVQFGRALERLVEVSLFDRSCEHQPRQEAQRQRNQGECVPSYGEPRRATSGGTIHGGGAGARKVGGGVETGRVGHVHGHQGRRARQSYEAPLRVPRGKPLVPGHHAREAARRMPGLRRAQVLDAHAMRTGAEGALARAGRPRRSHAADHGRQFACDAHALALRLSSSHALLRQAVSCRLRPPVCGPLQELLVVQTSFVWSVVELAGADRTSPTVQVVTNTVGGATTINATLAALENASNLALAADPAVRGAQGPDHRGPRDARRSGPGRRRVQPHRALARVRGPAGPVPPPAGRPAAVAIRWRARGRHPSSSPTAGATAHRQCARDAPAGPAF